MLAAPLLASLFVVAFPAPAPAAVAPQAAEGRGPFMPAYHSACIRSLREFAYELSSAVEAGDVNRFAALYRWEGTSTRAGYETMTRLQEIVARPLLQVEPVYPQPPDPMVGPPAMASIGPARAGAPAAAPAMDPVPAVEPPADPLAASSADPLADPLAAGPPRAPPIALRLDQTLANGVTPAPTTLRLERALGCWWVSL